MELYYRVIHKGHQPHRLSKNRLTKNIKRLTKTEREKELEGVYTFDPSLIEPEDEILIVDDIITSGTTMTCIFQAIRQSGCKLPIHGFTLAHTDYQPNPNEDLELNSPTYMWQDDEWLKVAEPADFYGEVETLKQKILNDAF